jgi:hypothetical protein
VTAGNKWNEKKKLLAHWSERGFDAHNTPTETNLVTANQTTGKESVDWL